MMQSANPEDDIRITKRKTPPYWWPDVNVLLQLILSCAIVLMVGFILRQLLVGQFVLDQSQRDLLMVLLGVILACFKDVFGYTFGSSAGQKRQGEVITESLKDKDKIIATNVSTAADVAATALSTANAAAPPKTVLVVPWWPSILTDDEREAINTAAATDPKVQSFVTAATIGRASPDDLKYLVSKGLLTQERAIAIEAI